ncbi:sugar phosphate isomerase/epimerase family protein [Novipirellula artificiosorum]|uniref:Xylose isomerase-like TIM barrel n=1 Tax=Novipirellula artificiosorum TaxID=2528016 RepID=A0A5C6DBQ6_9BACT|nr:sugar phosphate isomerase/epimerase [Novipirellula artificiosorum]TWU33284.1 Xylose isomerase-like TIM barrel [Novipirellula artificiosorum]
MPINTPKVSRRTFVGASATLATTAMLPGNGLAAAAAKPNSKFSGVQIGIITYSYRSMPSSAEDILKYVCESGINSIELMGNTAEQFAQKNGSEEGGTAGFSALRKLYNDAGVEIHIVKFPKIGNANMSDEQIEDCFLAAKALGATGITRELSEDAAKRLGPIADKHEIMIGFHNHTQLKPTTYDGSILSSGKYLGINLDIGHYLAGTNENPLRLIEAHQDRILSLHIKDRKKDNGPNMPFGLGETPVTEVLQYMKENQLTFPADIELEYTIPKDSDAVNEVTKCVQFCKQALTS